ncbi:m29.1 protein [Murid betaherpesvirus 1]|nr:m29.1 protein [Murid betaherpesvirus 1]
METKEELWAKSFDLMVAFAGAGRMPVSDMKIVSRLVSMMTKEEEARFDKEVANEVHARYHSILTPSDDEESDSDDESDSDSGDALAGCGSNGNEFVATFDDIERMNLLMNKMLDCTSERHRSERKAKRKRKRERVSSVAVAAVAASSAATPSATTGTTNTTTTTAAGGPVAATVVSAAAAAPLVAMSVPVCQRRQPPPVPIRKSSRRNTSI